MRPVVLVNNRFPEHVLTHFSKEHLKDFPADRFAVEGTPEGDERLKQFRRGQGSFSELEEPAASGMRQGISPHGSSVVLDSLIQAAQDPETAPLVRARRLEDPYLISGEGLEDVKARWASGEVPLKRGVKYSFDGSGEWAYSGTLSVGLLSEYVYGADCSIRSKPADDVPAGYDNPNRVFVFTDGEKILIANSSRGFKPLEEVSNQQLLRQRYDDSIGAVMAGLPFTNRLAGEDMVTLAGALEIRPGSRVMGVEVADPYFPLVVARGCPAKYYAVSRVFGKGPFLVGESTYDFSNPKILYDQYKDDISEHDGRVGFHATAVEAVRDAGVLDAVLIPNWLDRAQTEAAYIALLMTFEHLQPGCRLLVSSSKPEGWGVVEGLLRQCTPRDRSLQLVEESLVTDNRLPPNGVVYEVRTK